MSCPFDKNGLDSNRGLQQLLVLTMDVFAVVTGPGDWTGTTIATKVTIKVKTLTFIISALLAISVNHLIDLMTYIEKTTLT